jgi:iron complex outermembrane receptor protein
LQNEFTITDKLILNAGVRYDDYETFGGTTNPRAALIYNPQENMSFKLVYGTAFRAPSAYELYFTDGVYQKSNPDLDAETIDTYEVIYEHFFTSHLRGTAVGYYYKMDDIIVNSYDPDTEMDQFVNGDEVEAYGLELEVDGKWENGWQGRISYAYQNTEDQDTNRELSNSPEHLLKLNVIAPLWRDKIFLGVEELYTSKRRTLYREKNEAGSDNYADSYYLTNVTLYGEKLWKNLDISASVYNLFDKNYDDPGAYEHLQDTLEREGRTYRLKISYLF